MLYGLNGGDPLCINKTVIDYHLFDSEFKAGMKQYLLKCQ